MPAILVQKEIKYACNVRNVRDPICLQCLKISKQLQSDRAGLKSHLKKISPCRHIGSLTLRTLQAYLIPFESRLQAYLVSPPIFFLTVNI